MKTSTKSWTPKEKAAAEIELRRRQEIELISSCVDDPVRFNNLVLGRSYRNADGVDVPAEYWSRQIEICEAVVKYKTVVVPTGNTIGKSFLGAGLVLWFLYTRPGSLVVTTAPSQTLLGSVLWKEIRRAKARSRIHLPGEVTESAKVSPQTLTVNAQGWQVIGIATRGVERLSGQHSPDLCVVIDEASALEAEIWEAIDSQNPAKLVVFGNPLRSDGRFRELSRRAEAERIEATIPEAQRVHEIRVPSTDSPDIDLQRSPRGLADLGFLIESERQYGKGSLWWRTHIAAEFPDGVIDPLIPKAWIDACIDPKILEDELWRDYPGGMPWMGVDVSGGIGRDRSVCVVRDRKRLLEVFASPWHGVFDDAKHRLENEVVRLAAKWHISPDRIVYDKAGPGRNFSSYLARCGLDGAIGSFGAGSGGRYFLNRRTANAYAVRRRLDPNRKEFQPFFCGGISEWPALRQELSELNSPTEEFEDGVLKQRLEEKSELAARLGRSPDLVDALFLSFCFED